MLRNLGHHLATDRHVHLREQIHCAQQENEKKGWTNPHGVKVDGFTKNRSP
jgi:hypothetical protein